MTTSSPTALRLSEVLAGLSVALDLTEGQPLGHAGRSCIVGMRLAEALDLPPADRSALYYALLLKDAGCSSNAAHVAALFGGDDRMIKHERTLVDRSSRLAFVAYVARNVRPGDGPLSRARGMVHVARFARRSVREIAQQRCERGAGVAQTLDLPDATADAIHALDERWDGSGFPDGLAGEQIPLLARILAVAQTAEVFAGAGGPGAATRALRARARHVPGPGAGRPLHAARRRPGLLGRRPRRGWRERVSALEPADRVLRTDDDGPRPRRRRVRGDRRRQVALHARALGAGRRDLRRPRAARHARRRPTGARCAAPPSCTTSASSASRTRSSTTPARSPRASGRSCAATRRTPSTSCGAWPPLRRIASVAAAHHERLDGSGYHRALRGDELDSSARLIAVADVYEALTSPRPYQQPVEPRQALAVIGAQAPHALWTQGHRALAEASGRGPPGPRAAGRGCHSLRSAHKIARGERRRSGVRASRTTSARRGARTGRTRQAPSSRPFRGSFVPPNLPPPFRVEVLPDPQARCVFVVPQGELDLMTAGELRAALMQAVDDGAAEVVLDMRELTFIDSTGIRLLVQTESAARVNGRRFAIIDGTDPVARLLAMTGLSDQFKRHGA